MSPLLVAVWLLLPCESTVITDHVTHTTTVYACHNTFGEADGPFVAEGRGLPPVKVAPAPKKKEARKRTSCKKRWYWKRGHKRYRCVR